MTRENSKAKVLHIIYYHLFISLLPYNAGFTLTLNLL